MSSEYTPTTEDVRQSYIREQSTDYEAYEVPTVIDGGTVDESQRGPAIRVKRDPEARRQAGPEFDRWLTAELAEAEKRGAVRALDIAKFAPLFWPRVTVGSPGECWEWTGPTVGIGHGRVDSPAGFTAHRYAWAHHNGRAPEADEVVRHRCDNPPCCNPAHLMIGSQQENVDDMVARKRGYWNPDACPQGHPRTPENTLIYASGGRRCKPCVKASGQRRRNGYSKYKCMYCDHTASGYNLRRHIMRVHGETLEISEVRDRADQMEAGG